MDSNEYGEPTPIYQYLTPEKETESGHEGWAIITDPEAGARPVQEYRLCLVPSKSGDRFAIFLLWRRIGDTRRIGIATR